MAKGITLIGMPGAGKSTIGRMLATRLGFSFVDLDNLIRDREGKTHSQIAREKGDAELSRLEEFYTLGINLEKTVFAPGGSIVYLPLAMEKITAETKVIYLDTPLEMIAENLGYQIDQRGIIGLKEKGLAGVFAERRPLYERYAYDRINCRGLKPDEICERLASLLG